MKLILLYLVICVGLPQQRASPTYFEESSLHRLKRYNPDVIQAPDIVIHQEPIPTATTSPDLMSPIIIMIEPIHLVFALFILLLLLYFAYLKLKFLRIGRATVQVNPTQPCLSIELENVLIGTTQLEPTDTSTELPTLHSNSMMQIEDVTEDNPEVGSSHSLTPMMDRQDEMEEFYDVLSIHSTNEEDDTAYHFTDTCSSASDEISANRRFSE